MTTTGTLNLDTIDKDCNSLNMLFEAIVCDMKNSPPLWEDFINKTSKLQTQLKSTMIASNAFLDSFQKIADLATNNTKGITKDIGALLTRLCIRHRAIEAKFKQFTSSLSECVVQPLSEKLEEWKRTVVNLDKEHSKEYKKLRIELKKKATDTLRLQKKLIKKNQQYQQLQQQTCLNTTNTQIYNSLNEIKYKYENSLKECSDYYTLLEETEKQHLRLAMIEERNHFCTFFKLIKPIIDIEMSMLDEVTHMEDIVSSLNKQTNEPHLLPNSITCMLDQMVKDLKGSSDYLMIAAAHNNGNSSSNLSSNRSNSNGNLNSPPSSPSSLGSRKSSVCSINSLTSSSSSSSHSRSPGHLKFRLTQQQHHLMGGGINRLSSVSSQDSGFTSQEQFFLKSPHLLDDKESIEYKMAMTCGTIKAWAKNGNNAFNIQNHHLHVDSHSHQLQVVSNSQASNSSSSITNASNGGNNSNDCAMSRHTVAGLPNNSNNSEHCKTRPALSVHTFEPPEQSASLIGNPQHIECIKPTTPQQPPPPPPPPPPPIAQKPAAIQQQHQQYNANVQQYLQLKNGNARQRSTTLPPEAIAEGMKELMLKNPTSMSPSKIYGCSTTLAGAGSSDTLLEEEIFTTTTSTRINNQNQRLVLNSNTIELTTTTSKSPCYSPNGLSRNASSILANKPTPPVRRNSSISSSTHSSYLYTQQRYNPSNNEIYIENNYDDIQNIQKYNINIPQQQQQKPSTILAQALAGPPPPPPPPLHNLPVKQQQPQDSFDSLPPPPASFYSDVESTDNFKQQQQQQQQKVQVVKQQTTSSSHQVLMSQIQYGVKLKPIINRQKM